MPRGTACETLLEVALRLLEERGSGALRVRDLSEAVGKSTMGVYTHFGSEQGLLEQLYLHGFSRLEDRLKAVAAKNAEERRLRLDRSGWGRAVAGSNPVSSITIYLQNAEST